MVGERRNGNLLVHLGPKLQAHPEELIRQRRGHDGHTEYLIRWSILSLEEGPGSSTNASSAENKAENILMWMSAEEVYANCPTLLGKRKPEGQRVKEEKAPSTFPPDVTLDEASLLEMKADVRNLVQRASRQMAGPTGPESSILNTIHVLSAYASIGSLTGVFKETGALDLLMKMLCNEEKQIRRSAGKMLRALASHDAGSRAYVLLSLSQQDGIEQHMDFDSRYTLLELFAETTSSEEHCMSFEGIHLPQVPAGLLLFSLVKRYLCVTSLVDKLNSSTELGGERQDCAVPCAHVGERSRMQREFEFSMAMANLISELVRVMGWDRSQRMELLSLQEGQPRVVRSIFQPKAPACSLVQVASCPPQKEASAFKTRSAFPSRSSYVEYVQGNLVRGMRVRMLEDYEQVSAGDEGEFRQSNDGTPPVQVYWQVLGRTYWVHWHMVEIVSSSGQAEREGNCPAEVLGVCLSGLLCPPAVTQTFYCKPLGGLYSLPYLTDRLSEDSEALSRAEWWELLFFVKKLDPHEQQEVAQLIRQHQELLELDEEALIQLSVPAELAQKVLRVLSKQCQGCTLSDLHSSRVYSKYFLRPGGVQPGGLGLDAAPSECAESLVSKKPKKDPPTARVPVPAPAPPEKSDCQLFSELLRVEGLPCLEMAEEKAKGMCRPGRELHAAVLGKQVSWLPGWCPNPQAALLPLQVVQEFVCFLHRLATTTKDCAVVMCRLGTKEALSKALDKHNSNLLLGSELRDLVTDCEKYASLYQKLTTSILAGCIQMVLGQIEEHRRSHQPINIPFFDVFLRNLCQGSSVEVKEDKCWEKLEVSSNSHRANKLTDRNPKTYWESNGSTGSHYINIYMHRGVVVRQMSLLVASEDSSYMPARIVVMGGENPASISTELNTVNVMPSASRVILLENLTRFWPIIQIKVKRCQQGGIDTRVRGIEILGPKPTFWPIFKEQLCRRTYLFYTTQAHTWCQEIADEHVQLLQLFNRLNCALRHEQVFADRFLPDDEAAQALGRTCWEALINPLVQSITRPDPSGVSPLAWLLSEYLENLETGRCAKSRATIFNSRVRRLSHLLVHVDPGSLEPEELRAPVKNKETSSGATKMSGKKPSSMTGITQCWRGVVQQQVKRFLESAWQGPDFVERYCRLYRGLHSAMEELFGQQTAFALALRQGFSGGLLQLSFLTAMHVSEQFARYIDQQIQESQTDVANVESLHRLQQSLEPILFLSGLELANTFEHFYRYYLGDRLLAQGNVWLERAVIEQIGLCFPNRFPQQMLRSLSESEELQQQFHLFQLQQLDKRLLELDAGQDDAEPAEPEEEPEVKVLALSPRCWTISPLCYLEDPSRCFPQPLGGYLARFADFYTNSQNRFGLEHTKPRRLQWTWLGHAELQFVGSTTLHVSTLQMYILLGFNSAQVGPPLPLGGGTPQLVQIGHQLLLSLHVAVLVPGVLRLNEAALARAAGQRLWLLPKQTYLNVEDDEGSTLERKRNIICCLIIQILKGEKELHIDNLVFRVIDACQKWESGPALKFLSFCCSSTDVLSCTLHLLSQGYLRRQEDNPQLLEYVSTEPTPSRSPPLQCPPQVTFQTVEIKTMPNTACAKRQTFSTFR
uniref:Cullin-9 n=1 Tax=Gopherus evgoodei TaxID=1825980 RepID=A0A8C4VG89_9SAUR